MKSSVLFLVSIICYWSGLVFGSETIELKTGEILQGEIVSDSLEAQWIHFRFLDGREFRIKKNDIQKINRDINQPYKNRASDNSVNRQVERKKGNPGLVLQRVGLITFGAVYGLTVGTSIVEGGTSALIPVIGPFIQMGSSNTNKKYEFPLLMSGILQSAAVITAVVGFSIGSNEKQTALITPIVFPAGQGVMVSLAF